MIKFFRKIRYDLMEKNKTGKYLKYAIGEIVLVVIGILIALSINNANTYRKDRIKEKELLNEIVVNLELNKQLIVQRIGVLDLLNEMSDLILKLQDKQIVYADSLDWHIYGATALAADLSLTNQGFEYLKNEGFDIILDENIRSQIINLFNVTYNQANIRLEKAENRHIHQYQYIDENFGSEKSLENHGGFLHPYDVDKTFSDNYFFSIISSFKHSREQLKYFLEIDIDKTEELLIQLKKK
jgi:hypothetical protein